ncbi:hypothetical protein EBR66_01505 [bacterium]|nr:hypothetical protein [bacterium]
MNTTSAYAAHRALLRVVQVSGGLFVWVALYAALTLSLHDVRSAFIGIVLAYALSHALTILFLPLCMEGIENGIRRMMLLGTGVLSFSFAFLALTFGAWGDEGTLWNVMIFAALWGLYRTLYLVPYEVASRTRRSLLVEFCLTIVPFLTALMFVLFDEGPRGVFVASSILTLLSMLPLFSVPDSREYFAWSSGEVYRRLFDVRSRELVVRAFLGGLERAAFLLVWSLVILTWVKSLLLWGIIMSFTLLTMMLFALVRARVHRAMPQTPLVLETARISTWILRGLAASPAGVLFVQLYSIAMPQSVIHDVSDAGIYIDEYTALKEVAASIGAVLLCAFAALCATILSIPLTAFWCFVLVAVLGTFVRLTQYERF